MLWRCCETQRNVSAVNKLISFTNYGLFACTLLGINICSEIEIPAWILARDTIGYLYISVGCSTTSKCGSVYVLYIRYMFVYMFVCISSSDCCKKNVSKRLKKLREISFDIANKVRRIVCRYDKDAFYEWIIGINIRFVNQFSFIIAEND